MEEIFARLNASTPLSPIQKTRSIMGSEMALWLRELCQSDFLTQSACMTVAQLRREADLEVMLQGMLLLDARHEGYEYTAISTKEAYLLRVDEDTPYKGYFAEVENSLKAEQDFVGGHIGVISLNDEVDLIYNEEGCILNLPVNRALVGSEGMILTLLLGNLMCVRHKDDEFVSIKEEDVEVINKHLIPAFRLLDKLFIAGSNDELPDYEGGVE